VDEVSNLLYMTTYNNLLGYGPNGVPAFGKIPGTLIGFHQDPATYAVVGQVFSAGVAQTGITATITGTNFSWSFVTGSNGIFATRVVPGTYTVTLSNPAFQFSPATLTFTVGEIDLSLPAFNATPIFHITGTVLTQAGTPVSGVTINATGTAGSSTAVTGSTGQYSLAGLPAGTYTVTPASPMNFYSPSPESVQVNKTDVAAPTFTVDPSLQIVSFTVSSPQIGAGSNATGTITINEVAPKGGIAITLASSDMKTIKPPTTLTIAAGASSGSFTFTGSGTATVALTATYSGTLAVAPTSATAQVSVVGQDTVKVTSATWSTSTQQLNVSATSTNPQAVLTVTLASNGQNLGTMTSQGNGTFTLQVLVATKPSSVNVKSNLGGSTGQGVTVLP
jgi:Carboxypeptidase regulatory-like domain